MVSVSSVRNKLQTKVFDKLGSILVINARTSTVKDKWGDETPTYGSNTNSQAVPYNYVKDTLKWEGFGDFQEGDVVVVLPYGTTIGPNDKVTYDSQTWYVRQIEEFPMGDGTTNSNLATGVVLKRAI